MPFREPRLVERGTDRRVEHGPGAAQVIVSLRRVRPLKRRSMLVLPEAQVVRLVRSKVVTRFYPVLVHAVHMGGFFVVN